MILGIGEILWDIYPDGRKVAGGAPFNFAFHCHQLGHPSAIVSRVGDDDLGRELRRRVCELGLSDEFIQTDPALPTGTVCVTVDDGGQPAYVIDVRSAWGNLEWTPALAGLAERAAAVCHGTLALVGGTGSRDVIHTLASQVERRDGLTIYDVNLRGSVCSQPDETALARSRWVKVNADELGTLAAAVDVTGLEPGPAVLEFLRKKSGRDDRVLIVTHGGAGAEVLTQDYRYREPAVPVRAIDTVGAGDAFTAALVCLNREGRPLSDCLRFANRYAARVCEFQGATPQIDRKAVEKELTGS